jgi:hypothetical protein
MRTAGFLMCLNVVAGCSGREGGIRLRSAGPENKKGSRREPFSFTGGEGVRRISHEEFGISSIYPHGYPHGSDCEPMRVRPTSTATPTRSTRKGATAKCWWTPRSRLYSPARIESDTVTAPAAVVQCGAMRRQWPTRSRFPLSIGSSTSCSAWFRELALIERIIRNMNFHPVAQ